MHAPNYMDAPREPLKNVCGAGLARQIQVTKRSLHVVNEHFLPEFNEARASKVIFQRFPSIRFKMPHSQDTFT